MAENVKQLQMQAAHMDRMSAVGQLAGGVAHEINNPLTAVLGQSQILLAKIPESDPAYAALKKIENAAIRCRKIVRGLLDFSRPSQSTFEYVDVNETSKSTLDLCEADLRKAKVNVEKRLGTNLPKIQGNTSELQQILLNLINNAIQAMPRGGVLTVGTSTSKKPLTVYDRRKGAPPKSVEGPWVEVTVSDTGVGIPPEHINRIFEPFFTTKEIGQGTGLGLAVSMGIVQKHGGQLQVESEGINRGATFRLILPLKKVDSSSVNFDRKQGMAA
jgi:two-component system NtrC family sensor kinase